MGQPHFPAKALLFVGILYYKDDYYIKSLQQLKSHFGEIAMITPSMEWNFSDYYQEELGSNIFRRFIFFKDLIEQDSIADIKIITNQIEKELSTNKKRNVNLDPGYLTPAKIVLATTKDYSHRIYLKRGIFAEVTLIFKKDTFTPHLNTYKDYRSKEYIDIFIQARNLLKIINR
ncbi:MAG: DUF4416 family protein [Thermodesulfovibrionales bacterium]|nr:DUF4416 family protein [Thermodesulfovibrionales bacterium]